MALATLLRSQIKLQNASPLIFNTTRMLSTQTTCKGAPHKSIVAPESQLRTVLLRPQQITSVGNRFAHQINASDANVQHGGHDKLWTAERFLSAGLLAVLPLGVMFPSQPLDTLMAISIVLHQYWGLEAVVVDYVRPILFGTVIPKIALGLLMLLTASTLGGLFYFIYNDIGIAKSIRKLWSIKGQ